MRIDLPQCGFKNCGLNSDGNCQSRHEYERCDHKHAIMILERIIKDHELCWLCRYERTAACIGRCTPIWNGLYFSK